MSFDVSRQISEFLGFQAKSVNKLLQIAYLGFKFGTINEYHDVVNMFKIYETQ